MGKFDRNINDLEQRASKWWPTFLAEKEASTSIIPLLLKTQDEFLSILNLSKEHPEQVFDILGASKFAPNLFLKHLAILADFGGEPIQRINSQFHSLFPETAVISANEFEFIWSESTYRYTFQALPYTGTLNNKKLNIDTTSLVNRSALDGLTRDMIMILLHGSTSTNPDTAEVLRRCEIGNLLGRPDELERYVKEKYIWVSRITGGAQANALGQVAQQHLCEFLSRELGSSYVVTPNGYIEGITQNDGRTHIRFDIVVGKNAHSAAVEVSFQVTTNSTIERKAGQAASRYRALKERGHHIAYVIDGAGNFQRRSAISTICANSDCTVAYTEEEFSVLLEFIKGVLG